LSQDEDPGLATRPIVKLPESMPDRWDLDSQHMLAPSEYEEAEQAALLANLKGSGLGQPGIGPLSLALCHQAENLTFNQEKLSS